MSFTNLKYFFFWVCHCVCVYVCMCVYVCQLLEVAYSWPTKKNQPIIIQQLQKKFFVFEATLYLRLSVCKQNLGKKRLQEINLERQLVFNDNASVARNF